MKSLRFVDLFAGIGGFHAALSSLGHECVFASELDEELRNLYAQNFPSMKGKVFGDIRTSKKLIPDHDILCAGFPCQPFSKSGGQLGTRDETRGTLFHEIMDVLEATCAARELCNGMIQECFRAQRLMRLGARRSLLIWPFRPMSRCSKQGLYLAPTDYISA